MNKETISARQGILLITMFIFGSTSLFIAGLGAKQDIWIVILMAIAVALIIVIMFARILSVLPGKDFFETLEFFFGKGGSKILFVILGLYALDGTVLVLINFGEFIVNVGLPETPINMVCISMILVCAIATKYGIEVLGRWNQIGLILITIFILIGMFLAIPKMELTHLRPTLYHGLEPVLQEIPRIIAFPLSQVMIFLLAFPAFKGKVSKYKVFLVGTLLGGLLFMATSCMDVLVMGIDYAMKSSHPTYETLSVLKAGVFDRLEILAASVFTFAVFLKISVYLIGTCQALSRAIDIKNYRSIVIPVTLLMCCIAFTSFDSITGFREFTKNISPYYETFFLWVIPIFIYIFIEIKYQILKRKRKLPC